MMTSSSSDTNLASSMSGGFRVLVVDDSASRLEAIIELLNRIQYIEIIELLNSIFPIY